MGSRQTPLHPKCNQANHQVAQKDVNAQLLHFGGVQLLTSRHRKVFEGRVLGLGLGAITVLNGVGMGLQTGNQCCAGQRDGLNQFDHGGTPVAFS